ncbi:hypothetical protein [Pantoea agglomerans]|uniref:hypothetical protein n=1 Tax=Enterobacter agglomerans TaxID=549 RepID=UPI00045CDF47|nr:hypothetical protein [Pantoea agglomerans]KDA96001.1 hypothetical protein T296_03910 [Pantoea agglomerans Eh318]
MNDNIIKWRDESDLSRGFVIDFDTVSTGQIFKCIYAEPHLLVNAFSDAFLLMRFPPEEAAEHANELYATTRDQMDQFIDRLRSKPYVQNPCNHGHTH